ncbi:hypothetical protein DM01DRAFT_300702 [Hesseltinella vesiculosa]|uniref:SAM domain-containing protein n=1 Tax=Hesseltinella vesiculosa TaxID=101127 RepID=A0A1X2GV92_9FUNG|nr:hypothetical protein DM01DRAFT_300702 [Hesseltinella vesiculosa]
MRPVSENMKREFKTNEASYLDKLSEDLQQQQHTLESLAQAKLDPDVQDGIKHVDRWFRQLNDTEKTVLLYTLLQQASPLQARFLITILQPIGNEHPLHLYTAPDLGAKEQCRQPFAFGEPSLEKQKVAFTPFTQSQCWEPLLPLHTRQASPDLTHRTTPPPTRSNDLRRRTAPSLVPPSPTSADWSHWTDAAWSLPTDPWPAKLVSLSPLSLKDSPTTPPPSNGTPRPLPTASTSQNQRHMHRHRFTRNVHDVDMNALRDVPSWLKSLRLHKYTSGLQSMPWQDLVKLTDEQLIAKGVHTKGARDKLLRAFECVRLYCESNDIDF